MSEKKADRRNVWQKAHQERIVVMVDKGKKDEIRKHAAEIGVKSLNAYIVSLIDADMGKTNQN